MSVEEKLGSQSAARWDRIAGRLVTVNGKQYFTGALLLFPHHEADDVLSAVDRMAKGLKKNLRRDAKKQGEPAEVNDHDVRQMLLSGSLVCLLREHDLLAVGIADFRHGQPSARADGARRDSKASWL